MKVLRARSEKDLSPILDYVHDRSYEIERLIFDSQSKELRIPVYFGSKECEGVLVVKSALRFEIRDEAKIGEGDINTISHRSGRVEIRRHPCRYQYSGRRLRRGIELAGKRSPSIGKGKPLRRRLQRARAAPQVLNKGDGFISNKILRRKSADLEAGSPTIRLGMSTHTLSYDAALRINGIVGRASKTYGYDALVRLTGFNTPRHRATCKSIKNPKKRFACFAAARATYFACLAD